MSSESKASGPEFLDEIMGGSDYGDGDSVATTRMGESVKKFNLPERYTIYPDRPVREFTGIFSKAFEVRDAKQKEGIYASIISNILPIRFSSIQKARQFFHPNFSNVADSGFTDVARGEIGSFAIICEKPRGVPLSAILEEHKKNFGEVKLPQRPLLNEDFIASEIVSPINEVLKLFMENEIVHGRINHDTVFITSLDAPGLVLAESFSEPCGYSQYASYEDIHRAQAMPLGKGAGTLQNDYFALGVLVLYCITGDMPGRIVEQNEFISQRLVKGSYNAYVGTAELPPRITDLLRGLLTDSPNERWGYEQVYNWVRGKKYNLIRPKGRREAVRHYDFAGVQHFNKKHLAHTYFLNWDLASKDIRDKKLIKWLDLSVSDLETGDNIAAAVASAGGEKSKSRADDDELVAKTLILLDPDAPIRLRNMAVNVDGAGAVLANAWAHQSQADLQNFHDIIRLNLLDYKAVRSVNDQKADRWVLQRLQNNIKFKGIGFGMERCLYDLNPTLACQSSMLAQQYIIDIGQLLYFLNDNATKLAAGEAVDRHIGAFLASKLELSQEIKLKVMRHLKDEKGKVQLVKLALLAFAQRKSNTGKLSGLGNWLASKLKNTIDSLHSRRLRKELGDELKVTAEQGNLENMLQLLCHNDYFQRDIEGFYEAHRNYVMLDSELKMIRARQALTMSQNSSYQYGLYLAKILGVLTFLTILVLKTA